MALVESAGRLVGVKELLRAGGVNPGEQTQLKRVLRDLVKQGRLEQDGKRFGIPGRAHERRSGPAWDAKKPTSVRARAGVSEGLARGREGRGRGNERGGKFRPPPERATTPRAPRVEAPEAPHAARGAAPVLIEGIINHHPDGFAFVRALTGKSEDVFIPPDQARKALDHDRVVVEVVP